MAVAANPYQGAPSPQQAATPPPQLGMNPYMGAPGGPHFGDPSSGWQPGPDVGTNGIPQAPAPAADPMANYLAQFNASLGESRKAIDTGLYQAMSELGQRRDAAAKIVTGLPAELQSSYAGAQQGLGQAAAAGQGALSQDVRGTVGALSGPLQSALAQEKGGGAAMQPYLNLANMANYQSGSAALNQQAMAGKQALDQQQAGFLQQLALAQMSRQQGNDDFYAHTAFQHQLSQEDAADAYKQQQQSASDQLASSETGGHIQTAAQLDAIRNSPAYRYAVQSMTQGLYQGDEDFHNFPFKGGPVTQSNKLSGADIAKKYAGNTDLLYALLADGHISGSDMAAAGISLPNPTGK